MAIKQKVNLLLELEDIKRHCNILRYFLSKQLEIVEHFETLSDQEQRAFIDSLKIKEFKDIKNLKKVIKSITPNKEWTIRELQAVASKAGVYKYSHMSKQQLIERLEQDGLI